MTALVMRTARKAGRCANAHAADVGNPAVAEVCKRRIEPGDRYAEGELNDSAGGFGRDRLCQACVDAGQA